MNRSFVIATALVVVGIVGGSVLDDRNVPPPVESEQYTILEVEFHAHTRFSDGFLSPFDLVMQAQRRGLDGIAVTEHNLVFPGKLARWFSELIDGPVVLVSQEITSGGFHLHGVGIEEVVDWDQPTRDVIAAVHEQGGIAIAAHPIRRAWPAFLPVRDVLDAAEVMHPLAFVDSSSGEWSWEVMRDFYRDARSEGFEIAPIAASDYHFSSALGVCRTLVFVESVGAEGVLEAIRAGRTVVFDNRGGSYGPDDLITELGEMDYAFDEQDYGYHGNGLADRVTRTIGWFGFLGLLLFKPRGRKH